MSSDFLIRRTRLADCAVLPEIERSAAMAFIADPDLAWLTEQAPISPKRHAGLIESGLCFVAVTEVDAPCGFIVSEPFATDLHIWEMSVEAAVQQRGIGRRLLAAIEAEARERGLKRLTMTTFRDIIWNGPFYQSCGFAELSGDAVTERLLAQLDDEAAHGLQRNRRCAMVKAL